MDCIKISLEYMANIPTMSEHSLCLARKRYKTDRESSFNSFWFQNVAMINRI